MLIADTLRSSTVFYARVTDFHHHESPDDDDYALDETSDSAPPDRFVGLNATHSPPGFEVDMQVEYGQSLGVVIAGTQLPLLAGESISVSNGSKLEVKMLADSIKRLCDSGSARAAHDLGLRYVAAWLKSGALSYVNAYIYAVADSIRSIEIDRYERKDKIVIASALTLLGYTKRASEKFSNRDMLWGELSRFLTMVKGAEIADRMLRNLR